MNERIKKTPESLLPNSPEDVLKGAAAMISHFEKQGKIELMKKNAIGYNEKMINKARTVAGLTDELNELSERGVPVSKEVKKWCRKRSKRAMRIIEDNNYFGMSVLLTAMELKEGEPNELEKFISHLESLKSRKPKVA